jgi:hypothetical protein
MLFHFNIAICQQININGTIREKGKDTNLPYANIGIYNTNIGTVSDKNGMFKLKVDSGIDVYSGQYDPSFRDIDPPYNASDISKSVMTG